MRANFERIIQFSGGSRSNFGGSRGGHIRDKFVDLHSATRHGFSLSIVLLGLFSTCRRRREHLNSAPSAD